MTQALEAKPAVLRATLTIKRKATGLVETYEIVGTPTPEFLESLKQPQEQPKED